MTPVKREQPIRRALISVADKTGLVEFAEYLAKHHVEIIATGGTATLLKQHHIPIIYISDYTGFPEMMDGRVKTLHPKIHGGLLARSQDHDSLKKYQILPIDLLIVNLYPFAQTIANPDCTESQAIENIDVGGPSMLRAGAKNYARVTVASDPADYAVILQEMESHQGSTQLTTRRYLAGKTFSHLTQYDATIAAYFTRDTTSSLFPEQLPLHYQKKMDLRYGENPHQAAALYVNTQHNHLPSLAQVVPKQGKVLSFNNLQDADCAYRCVHELSDQSPACVIVKHATPCGAAIAKTQLAAYTHAYATDPTSAFGGIIAFNTLLETETAKKILENQFVEVVIAPDISNEVMALFHAKPNIRVLACAPLHTEKTISLHTISGGLLAQATDQTVIQAKNLQTVTQRVPTAQEQKDLLFAWTVVKHVKSNAIVYAKNQATLGIGGGQTSRIFSAEIGAKKASDAKLSLVGSVMASDAFFPFADSVILAKQLGVTAIIQPGGSKRDPEVIEAADAADIAMLFTGVRHFRH